MKDERTEKERYEAWVDAVNLCQAKGWRVVAGWYFKSPTGNVIDLSASDLSKLDEIDKKHKVKLVKSNW